MSHSPTCKVLLLLFLIFDILVAIPKQLLYTVINPAVDPLNVESITKKYNVAVHPPRYSNGENKNKNKIQGAYSKEETKRIRGQRGIPFCIFQAHAWALRRSRSVSCPYTIPWASRLGQSMLLRKFYAFVYDNNFPSLIVSLFF